MQTANGSPLAVLLCIGVKGLYLIAERNSLRVLEILSLKR